MNTLDTYAVVMKNGCAHTLNATTGIAALMEIYRAYREANALYRNGEIVIPFDAGQFAMTYAEGLRAALDAAEKKYNECLPAWAME